MVRSIHAIKYFKSQTETRSLIKLHEFPKLCPGEYLVKVSAVGLNRADVLQREGIYIPPEGETSIPGVEIVGEIVDSSGTCIHQIGERVCGVVSGGGFSEYCILDEGMAMKVPSDWTDIEAAAFPEAALTAFEALTGLAGLSEGDSLLLHAASSGVGTMMLAMSKKMGLRTICTTTSAEKKAILLKLGADNVIVTKQPDFAADVLELTGGKGVNAVVDFLAGGYTNENILAAAKGGCVVVAGIMDAAVGHIDWITLINRRIRILPLTLRMKPRLAKHDVASRFIEQWWDGTGYRRLDPVVGLTFPVQQLDIAQNTMLENRHVGKIVIDCSEGWAPHD